MRCPACSYYASNDTMRVVNHMMETLDKPHLDWMESQNLNPPELIGVNKKGNYKLLADVLDKMQKEKRL